MNSLYSNGLHSHDISVQQDTFRDSGINDSMTADPNLQQPQSDIMSS